MNSLASATVALLATSRSSSTYTLDMKNAKPMLDVLPPMWKSPAIVASPPTYMESLAPALLSWICSVVPMLMVPLQWMLPLTSSVAVGSPSRLIPTQVLLVRMTAEPMTSRDAILTSSADTASAASSPLEEPMCTRLGVRMIMSPMAELAK